MRPRAPQIGMAGRAYSPHLDRRKESRASGSDNPLLGALDFRPQFLDLAFEVFDTVAEQRPVVLGLTDAV